MQSRFRDSRYAEGRLTLLAEDDRLKVIEHMVVVDLERNA